MNAIDRTSESPEAAEALAELNCFASEWKFRQELAELGAKGCFGWPGSEFSWLLDHCSDGFVGEGAEEGRICDRSS